MRLGVVGMLPPDFRDISSEHLDAIKALDLTGAAFHAPANSSPKSRLASATKSATPSPPPI